MKYFASILNPCRGLSGTDILDEGESCIQALHCGIGGGFQEQEVLCVAGGDW